MTQPTPTRDAVKDGMTVREGGRSFWVPAWAVTTLLRSLEAILKPSEPAALDVERLSQAKPANHYEWFMPAATAAAVDEYLDDFEVKMREALFDPYVHDMAQAVLPLIAAYRAVRDRPAEDSE